MMHIGIVVDAIPPWGVGGNPREAAQIIKTLISNGIEVSVFCYHSFFLKRNKHCLSETCLRALSTDLRMIANKLQIIPVKSTILLPHLSSLMNIPQTIVTLINAATKLDIDILLAYTAGSTAGLATPIANRSIKKKCVIRTTGNDILHDAQKYPFLIKPSLLSCDLIVPISEYMRDLILGYFPQIEKQRVQIIPVEVDTDLFNPNVDASNIRIKHNLENAFVILSVARLEERKGIHYLLLAMREVLKKMPNAKLIVIGDGPEKRSLLNLVHQLNVTESVIIESYVPDNLLPCYYAACDIFVLPSIIDKKGRTEAFGKVLAEALACEKPVIGTKVGGIPLIVQDGETGFLEEPCQPKALADAILKLRDDPKLRQRMGKHGRSIVVKKYDSRKIMKQWLELFISLLS